MAGFTLIELLVVIAIIALLIGILLPALGTARACVRGVRDTAAARDLMVAYTMYADDNQGRLLTGFLSPQLAQQAPPVVGRSGDEITGLAKQRYPWRLAPYFENNLDAFYKDRQVAESISQNYDDYAVSLYPSFGINGFFVGGSANNGLNVFTPTFRRAFGTFWLEKMTAARRPSSLLVFASSRAKSDEQHFPAWGGAVVEGFHEVRPPSELASTGRKWQTTYDADAAEPGLNAGFVSLRHNNRAAVAMLDGHAEQLTFSELDDMRLWADQADAKDWAVPVRTK
jgi:prepilin-type N-terminal cleavage/methylation domain-containing protein/prepilin-type processing-associated H-X9-DG protein